MSWLSDTAQYVSDTVYNAATGKLSDVQKQAIRERTDRDIEVAAQGNVVLAEQQKAQAHKELEASFTLADKAAEKKVGIFDKEKAKDWSYIIAGFILLISLVLLVYFSLKIVKIVKA